jgi:hypothetical protein
VHSNVFDRPHEILMAHKSGGEVERLLGLFLGAQGYRPFTQLAQQAVERRQSDAIVLEQIAVAQVDPKRRLYSQNFSNG